MAEAAASPIEIAFVGNPDACESRSLVGKKGPLKRFEPRVNVPPPESLKDINHSDRPHGCARGIGNMTEFLSIRR